MRVRLSLPPSSLASSAALNDAASESTTAVFGGTIEPFLSFAVASGGGIGSSGMPENDIRRLAKCRDALAPLLCICITRARGFEHRGFATQARQGWVSVRQGSSHTGSKDV